MKLYKITINFKNGEKVIYVFGVETTKKLLWYFDKAKENDEIKINLMDVSSIECEEI